MVIRKDSQQIMRSQTRPSI
uniref:Uncharacterized protein n=1 Tax=Anguilla anguilla TaxID=7936 RepID=A0A0E9XU66_ANGAN